MDLVDSENAPTEMSVCASAESVWFGVVMPVHDEEEMAPAALVSIDRAIAAVSEPSVTFGIAIVLDACSDRSGQLVAEWQHRRMPRGGSEQIQIVTTDAGSVGHARKLGCAALLRMWADRQPEAIWLATTDADSEVPRDWITAQLRMRREGGQVWVGPVSVHDWSNRSAGTADVWRAEYDREYLPIHGANFGIDAATYLGAGGFAALPSGEDRDLFQRTVSLGAVVRCDPHVRVVTSGRREARAPKGFANALNSIEARIAATTTTNQPELTAS
jgi:hypothetical protein